MIKEQHIPFYAKIALILLSIFAFVFLMIAGKTIIVPIIYATILAILLNPLVNFMIRRKINRIAAISIAVILTTLVVAGAFYLTLTQVASFSDSLPLLKIKMNGMTGHTIQWMSEKLNINEADIYNWINKTENTEISHLAIGEKLNQVTQILVTMMLLPIYLILILYYKPLFLEFIRKLFRAEHHIAVGEVLTNSKKIIQQYLTGLIIEMLIMMVLNSIGLLALDMDYAILLGIIGALLNVIPFIGGVLGIALFILISLVTKSPVYMLYILAIFSVIQIIDKNYIVPKIVSSRVQINAFISLIVVIIGGAIWGINGMFLSIPMTAIVKVIFDHIEPMKPWGYLLGNTVPEDLSSKKK